MFTDEGLESENNTQNKHTHTPHMPVNTSKQVQRFNINIIRIIVNILIFNTFHQTNNYNMYSHPILTISGLSSNNKRNNFIRKKRNPVKCTIRNQFRAPLFRLIIHFNNNNRHPIIL